MKKAQIAFEVTESKTIVTAIGLNGFADSVDITGTEVEKDFTRLLKKLRDFQITNKIVEALDINNWEQV